MDREVKFSFFNFINQIFFVFGIQVLFNLTVVNIFPFPIEEVSSFGLFKLGRQGIASSTLLQFFITSIGASILVTLFTTNLIFKKMLFLWRSIFMFAGIILFLSFMIVLFDWFPINNLAGWISFFITFGFFFITSVSIMILKTHYESKKYEKILKDFKERKGVKEDE